ncbi:Mpv17 / PMP22 family [Aspergillus sp. HF37]|nr:Mpv17 / PMP22 family [Aspergillus sp. HF37]
MPTSPLTATLIQSTILNAIANLLAQFFAQYGTDKPFHLNTLALAQYLAYNLLVTPLNFAWQRFLEARYPGFPRREQTGDLLPFREKKSDDDGPPLSAQSARHAQAPSGMRSFVAKFLLDQSVGSVMNILFFIVLITLLQGRGVRGCWEAVLVDFKPIMIARLKYRPVVSTLLYTVVPVDRRVVFGSGCGVIWGVRRQIQRHSFKHNEPTA